MTPKYGKIEKRTMIDDLGSQKIVTTKYRDYKPYTTINYEIRVLVKDQTEELAEYVRFRKENKNKSAFRTEPNNSGSGYYIVKCWEEIE